MSNNYFTSYIIDRIYIMIGQKKYIYFIEMYKKTSPDLQNGQKFRNRQESWLKEKKDEE